MCQYNFCNLLFNSEFVSNLWNVCYYIELENECVKIPNALRIILIKSQRCHLCALLRGFLLLAIKACHKYYVYLKWEKEIISVFGNQLIF